MCLEPGPKNTQDRSKDLQLFTNEVAFLNNDIEKLDAASGHLSGTEEVIAVWAPLHSIHDKYLPTQHNESSLSVRKASRHHGFVNRAPGRYLHVSPGTRTNDTAMTKTLCDGREVDCLSRDPQKSKHTPTMDGLRVSLRTRGLST